MKKLMLTTALVAVTSLGAVAQTAPETTAPMQGEITATTQAQVPAFLASNFIGQRLYTLDSESAQALDARPDADSPYETRSLHWTSSDIFTAERDAWEDIGVIDDVVMSQDGEIRGVLIDVGGFLGLFSRTVMVEIDELYFVADDANPEEIGDFAVVASMSREQLEALPEWDDTTLSSGFEPRAYAPATMEQGYGEQGYGEQGQAQMEPGHADTTMAAETQPMTGTDYAAEGYAEIQIDERTAETLTGANVYDAAEDNIGNVTDLVLDGDNSVTHVLVDVGGFLGIGSHTVALPVEDVNILWHDANDDVRIHVQMTREQLETLPEYQG